MRALTHPERFITRQRRGLSLISYLLILGMAFRRITLLDDAGSIALAGSLLAGFTLLYATHARIARTHPGYTPVYLLLQIIFVQALAPFQEYLDSWALLYIVLSVQVAAHCRRKQALMWGGLFAAATLVTLSIEFGILSGLGRGLAYIAIGVFLISFDIQVAQRQDAQEESQLLLNELRAAHDQLRQHAAQAERLAAAQERNRIAQEIYDAIGQKIFAIQLFAETACLQLEQEQRRRGAGESGVGQFNARQLDLLQEQTQAALSQMRQLIARWRPTPPEAPSLIGSQPPGLPLPAEP